jgi:hypothetical protein
LIGDADTPERKINVDVVDGAVTLRGTVDTAEAKSEAERIAKETDGVKKVTNQLKVAPPRSRLLPSRPRRNRRDQRSQISDLRSEIFRFDSALSGNSSSHSLIQAERSVRSPTYPQITQIPNTSLSKPARSP